jgi:glycogen synthase
MRVVLLGPYPPPHGGVQTNLVAIRRYLRESGFSCAVINLTRFRRTEGDEVFYPRNAPELMRLLLRDRYDIIHLHIGGNLSTRLVALCFFCSLIPWSRTVLTFHSGGYPSSPEGRSARARSLRGWVLRRIDRVIAVNSAIVELFVRFGLPPQRVRLIPPYQSQITTVEPLPEPLAGFFGSHHPVLVTVGLLEPEYDLPLQIGVFENVRKCLPDAGLVIIGSGSREHELRDWIRRASYPEAILLCGDVAHPSTLQAIAAADMFLRTTRYDGDSVAVREALQSGTPVIATDNGMRPEGVHLVPIGDSDALYRAIVEQAGRPDKRVQREPETGERNLQAVLDLYREALS